MYQVSIQASIELVDQKFALFEPFVQNNQPINLYLFCIHVAHLAIVYVLIIFSLAACFYGRNGLTKMQKSIMMAHHFSIFFNIIRMVTSNP
jgi:hypothetical protein